VIEGLLIVNQLLTKYIFQTIKVVKQTAWFNKFVHLEMDYLFFPNTETLMYLPGFCFMSLIKALRLLVVWFRWI